MKLLKDALRNQAYAIKAGITPTIFASNQLIHLYSKNGLLREAHKLFDEMHERNVFTWNAIISAYVKSRNLTQACTLFDSAPCKDSVTYNSMLSGYVSNDGCESNALNLFLEMQAIHDDHVRIDEFTVTTMLNLTAKLSVASYGRQFHCFMMKSGNYLSGFAVSSLIDMYSKCGCLKEASQVFNGCGGELDSVAKNAMVAACCREGELEMGANLFWREPELNDIVSWNTLISGYTQNGYEKESLKLFVHMVESGLRWNEHTLASILSACSGLKNLGLGKGIHAQVLKVDLVLNPFISSGIVDLYCKCGSMKYAELVHAATGIGNAFSISSMIVGHSSQGNMVEARRLFDSLTEKNYVAWTALCSGYARSQHYGAVFELLSEFTAKESMVPDGLILINVLGTCAIQATLDPGKQIHAYILRMGVEMDEKLATAMVDMYSKCGSIIHAENIFQKANNRDSVLYNVMIAGYAHHGHDKEAIQLFEELLERGLRPDAVTFVAVLSACRHCGLVELGEKFFNSMAEDYNIIPEIDHYSCMIDLYGRSNQLEKAVAFMRNVPIERDAVIWGAFLNACRINKNAEYAREAEENLLKIEKNGARYVQLANVYAAGGEWAEMGRIRMEMRGKEVKKLAGCSWVYVDNKANIFTSGDRSHMKADAIYSALVFLGTELNDMCRGDISAGAVC